MNTNFPNFGILKEYDLSNTPENEIANILVEKELFVHKKVFVPIQYHDDGILDIVDTGRIKLEPKDSLSIELYEYVIPLFNFDVFRLKTKFHESLRQETEDIFDELKKKKLVFKKFVALCKELDAKSAIETIERSESETGVEHFIETPKLKKVSRIYESIKASFFKYMPLNHYLQGNKDFFTRENILNSYHLGDTIETESKVQLIIELNDKYAFEEDMYLSKFGKLLANYKNYAHIFHSFEIFKWTNHKIRSFTSDVSANIDSLYDVLVQKNAIEDHKQNFIDFLKELHGINVAKIRMVDPELNYKHKERVEKLVKEFEIALQK